MYEYMYTLVYMHCMHTDCYLYVQQTICVNQRSRSNVGLMLHHRLRRWQVNNPAFDGCLIKSCLLRWRCNVGLTWRKINSESTLGERFVFAVKVFLVPRLCTFPTLRHIGPTYRERYTGAVSHHVCICWLTSWRDSV